MDIAQSFGASSSYARKYALNGLFLIDDTKDPDATNTHDSEPKKSQQAEDNRPWLNKGEALDKAMEYMRSGGKIETIESKYRLSKEIKDTLTKVAKWAIYKVKQMPVMA